MRNLYLLSAFILLFGCEPRDPAPQDVPLANQEVKDKGQLWLAELDLGEKALPFRFRLTETDGHTTMILLNAEEEIPIPDVTQEGDSIIFRMPFFDSEIRGKRSPGLITGTWYNHARSNNNRIPFEAGLCVKGCDRLPTQTNVPKIDGDWEVTFVYKEADSSKALGRFQQNGQVLSGTFMTPTGDYRYLEGNMNSAGEMRLSCFDGAHAFLFEAEVQDDGSLAGGFWSGAHWYESWSAVRTEHFAIDNPDSLTRLLPGYETVSFSFPDVDSNIVSLTDPRFKDKVVIVEVMGSWCPNCKDETALLHEMYGELKTQGLEIVSLSFEMKDDFAYGSKNIRRMIQAFGLEYPVLFAGKAGRKTAGAALPMLNHVMSYPTTMFVDRQGKVRRIYTGFSGPATGETYTRLVADFRSFTRKLLQESPV